MREIEHRSPTDSLYSKTTKMDYFLLVFGVILTLTYIALLAVTFGGAYFLFLSYLGLAKIVSIITSLVIGFIHFFQFHRFMLRRR